MTLAGHLEASHPLSPRSAFRQLNRVAQQAVAVEPASLWEQDNLLLSPALRRYRTRMRDYARDVIAPHALAIDREPSGPALSALASRFARDGLLTDFLPAPVGTLPLSVVSQAPLAMAIKLEEMAVACSGIALIVGAHGLGMLPLMMSGDVGLTARVLLPAFLRTRRGDPVIFAYALTEPTGGSDVEDSLAASHYTPRTVATRTGGGWLLNGHKQFISGGDHATHVAVFAALDGEDMQSTTCFLVDRAARGYTCVRTELKMGQRASHAAELYFDDLFVPDDRVVGKLRQGWAINRAILNVSRVPVAALALGIARGTMERTIALACMTKVGNRRLIDRQDAQLAIAQMMVDVSAMRAVVWQAAGQSRSLQTRSSIAKVFCSDTAVKVCQDALDLLGEAGLAADEGIEKGFRDARLAQIYEGTNQINRLAIIEDQMEWLQSMTADGQ
ncbi:MAG: acyl-CoA dehydrogenase family protein [Gammaproteobacteria bacterium]